MGKGTVPLTGRVPEPLKEKVGELAEEEQMSNSAMIRELVKDGIEHRETEDEPAGRTRSVSPLALLGVVSIAIAPTLLATGYTGVGVAAGAVAATYVLLWVTAYDVVVEEALDTARDELAEVGGVVGFFRYVMTDKAVEDPETPVERAANADLLGLGMFVAALVVGAPLAVLARVGYMEALLGVLGPGGALAYAAVIVLLAYLGAFFFGVSAVASLAIASARAAESGTAASEANSG